jgi:hypothetical protein
MNKSVLGTIFWFNEAEAFGCVEKFYCAYWHGRCPFKGETRTFTPCDGWVSTLLTLSGITRLNGVPDIEASPDKFGLYRVVYG